MTGRPHVDGDGAAAPIHVLHVVPTLAAGGLELALCRIVQALEAPAWRHSVAVIKGEAVMAGRLCGTDVYCLRAEAGKRFLVARLWRLIRQLRPSVIHARNWGALPEVSLARLMALHPRPLVFSFHGLCETVVPLRRRIGIRVLGAMATRVVTVSDGARRILAEKVGLAEDEVQVIPNGVDLRQFSPAFAQPLPGRRLIVGSVGHLTHIKNHALLVRACEQLSRQGTALDLRIAGAGPLEGELRRGGEALGPGSTLRLLGHVGDVAEFLRELDVFVLPSLLEAHPNALLEAMACGLSCVATAVGGSPEVLDQGACGMLVGPDDASGLARAIGELAADPARRHALGEAARRRACQAYSMEHMAKAYTRLYRELAGAKA